YVVGVDIGATKTRVGLFTLDCSLIYADTFPTPREVDGSLIPQVIVSKVREVSSRVGGEVVAVGIGTIGPLDIRRGDVVGTPNVGRASFRLKAPIEKALGVKTYVVNDCVAAVWGEYLVGAGRGSSNVVYITISTGIGGGAVVDDHLILGKDGNAHEVGHIVLDYSGRFKCGCGGVGHWEGIASGANIPKTASLLSREWGGPRTEAYRKASRGLLTPELLFSYWASGDAFADYLVDFLAEVNAAGIASAINVYDPEVVTIGGSIALRNPGFFKLIEGKIGKYAINRVPRVLLTPLGDDAVLVGAAMVAINTPPNLVRLQSGVSDRL
ncbi:MAG: ROK family protein, partial [Sulfolobales archaeon]